MGSEIPQTNKSIIKMLCFGHLFADVYGNFMLPIMPLIAAKLSISLGFVGLLLGISSFASALLQPLFGYISDQIKKRSFVFWGLIFSSFFISLTGIIHNIWLLGLVILLGSLGVGFFHPQATSLASYYSGKEIDKHMGAFIAYGTIGSALGPLLSSFLVGNFGLSSTVYAMIPGFIFVYLIYQKLPKFSVEPIISSIKTEHIKTLHLKRIIFTLVFISVIRALTIVTFSVFMPFIWERQHISVIITGILLSLFLILGGFSTYIGGKLSKRINKKNILIYSFLPAVPCLLGTLYFLESMPVLSFILFLMSGFILMSSTSVNIVIGQMAAPNNIGMISGLIGGFSWGVAGLLQSPIGFLATSHGIIPVLTIIALVPILGAIATAYISKRYS